MVVTLDSFMAALSGQESGGNYNAQNKDSGAYGRWQIMPANWPSWSAEAGIPGASPSDPAAQDRVVRYKLQQYFNTFGNWEDVAAAWYSGQPLNPATADNPQNGYPSIRSYVQSIMAKAGGGVDDGSLGRPPSGGGGGMAEQAQYLEALAEYNQLYSQYGLWLEDPDSAKNFGLPMPNAQQVQRLLLLEGQLGDWEDAQKNGGGGAGSIRDAYDFWNSTDPRVIDAENAANRYAREYEVRTQAAKEAGDEAAEQMDRVDHWAEAGRNNTRPIASLPATLQTGAELFSAALDRIKKGLPDVPDLPYMSRPSSINALMPTAGGGASGAGSFPRTPTPPGMPTGTLTDEDRGMRPTFGAMIAPDPASAGSRLSRVRRSLPGPFGSGGGPVTTQALSGQASGDLNVSGSLFAQGSPSGIAVSRRQRPKRAGVISRLRDVF